MDTRAKIVETLPQVDGKVVVGYFDPMHAGHARRLRELANGGSIAVIVADPAEPILPARARAELVASLDCVSHVVIGGSYDGAIDEREADSRRAREFAQHVLARHNRK